MKNVFVFVEFFQREKEKRYKSVRRQAKIGAGYLSCLPLNGLSLHNFTKTWTWSSSIDCVLFLFGCFRLIKALSSLDKREREKGSEGRGSNGGWAEDERLHMSGGKGPTKTTTKPIETSKLHLNKNREDASGPISMNKSVYFFEFLGDPDSRGV